MDEYADLEAEVIRRLEKEEELLNNELRKQREELAVGLLFGFLVAVLCSGLFKIFYSE